MHPIATLATAYCIYRAYRDRRLTRLIAEHGPLMGTLRWVWRAETLERELYPSTNFLR